MTSGHPLPGSSTTFLCGGDRRAYSFLEVSHDGNGGLSTCVFFAPFDDDDYNSSGASVLLFTFPCANFYAHSCTPAGNKVLIYKSRGKLSILVQPTIQCVFIAYFDPSKHLQISYFYVYQLTTHRNSSFAIVLFIKKWKNTLISRIL